MGSKQVIYLLTSPVQYSSYITAYVGATRTATVSVEGTIVEGYAHSVPMGTALPAGTPYIISLSYIASVTPAPVAKSANGAAYIIRSGWLSVIGSMPHTHRLLGCLVPSARYFLCG